MTLLLLFSAISVVEVNSDDTGSLVDASFLDASFTSIDLGSSSESTTINTASQEEDTGSFVDTVSVTAVLSSEDTGLALDFGSIEVTEESKTDIETGLSAEAGYIDISSDETTSSIDSELLSIITQDQDAGSGVETLSLVSLSSSDVGSLLESNAYNSEIESSDLGSFEETESTIRSIEDADTGSGLDEAAATQAVLPSTAFSMTSLVEVLRQRSTRVDGALSVGWQPLTGPANAGQLWVRFDLSFVRPGKDSLPPHLSGVQQDRLGVMFADSWTSGLLKAGDRIRCLSGPIIGTFEIRNIPDQAMGYSSAHHIEVEVVEVSQRPEGTYVPDTNFYVPSYMRHLYSSRVGVYRLITQSRNSGTSQDAWRQVEEAVDIELGIPGEMLCRIDLNFKRPGKDAPLPMVAGRSQDRVGILFCDITPYLRAGDRIRCIAGDIEGTFEIRAIPDLAPDLTYVHHMEMQVVETSQLQDRVVIS